MRTSNTRQEGFTLVEMAIGMVIIAVLVAFATVAFSGILTRSGERKTFADMELVADAISIYAQKHMRVPCPADPAGLIDGTTPNGERFGTEINSGAASNFGQCNDLVEAEGIIPFVTLGLPQHLAKDRFGNYITYRVSITSSQTPSNAVALPINNWCKTRPYWHADTDGDGTTDDFVAPAKAAFCCGTWGAGGIADVTGDIVILDSFDIPLPNISRAIDGQGGHVNEYIAPAPPSRANLINPGIPGFTESTVPPMFPAYILVSHGLNGAGAFLEGTGARNTTGMAGAELQNANGVAAGGDVTFYASDRFSPVNPVGGISLFHRNEDAGTGMDDLVFWATPPQVLGRIGGVSCSAP